MDLEISINNTIDDPEVFRRMLDSFERQMGVGLELQVFDWSEAWAEFMKISLYRHGPVISETGDTWMGSLNDRQSLRPFKENELAAIGGAGTFLDEMWQSCIDFDNKTVVAIPWSLDTYLVYYRRDLLAKARVKEETAFASFEDFTQTLAKLQRSGVEVPLAIPTGGNSLSTLHNTSSWVWEKGGDFISPDGRQVLLTRPKTLSGLREYFSLSRFLPEAVRGLDDNGCIASFINGEAAVTLRNPTMLYNIRHGDMPEDLAAQVGVAVQPGVPFVGGSNLVIWNHIQPSKESLAVALIRFLTSSENLMTLFRETSMIPARLETLGHLESDPTYAPLVQSFKTGRAYKRLRLWGLVEDKLTRVLNTVWHEIFTAPRPDINQILVKNLLPLEERLNITLLNQD
jgi:multiple sugar transport system substrate-binding protein